MIAQRTKYNAFLDVDDTILKKVFLEDLEDEKQEDEEEWRKAEEEIIVKRKECGK